MSVDTDTPEQLIFQGNVRSLRPGDIDSLRPVLQTWIRDRDTGAPIPEEVEEDLKTMLDSTEAGNSSHFLVAETGDGVVIGVIGFRKPDQKMIEYTHTPDPAEIINAYVRSDYRGGKGVGRALVDKLEEEAKKMGFTEVVLNSGPRYKDTGWGFYDKLPGYERVGIAKEYYGEGGDAPVWRKDL